MKNEQEIKREPEGKKNNPQLYLDKYFDGMIQIAHMKRKDYEEIKN